MVIWSPPWVSSLKFNVDGVASGKLGPEGVGTGCSGDDRDENGSSILRLSEGSDLLKIVFGSLFRSR